MDERQKMLWLREFQLNGFVVLRDFLPVDFVQEMHEELAPLLEAEYAKAQKDSFAKGRGPGRLSLHIAPYADMMQGALADARYRSNPIIEELIDTLFGGRPWKRAWTVAEVCWKGSDPMAWHSDQTPEETPDLDAPHEYQRLVYNIPLVDFTAQTGATEFIPGSHLQPRRFHLDGGVEGLAHYYPLLLELERGDAVLRDGNILHRGTPNVTDAPRPMLDQTYKSA